MYSCNIVLYGTRLLFCRDDSADVTWQVDWIGTLLISGGSTEVLVTLPRPIILSCEFLGLYSCQALAPADHVGGIILAKLFPINYCNGTCINMIKLHINMYCTLFAN